MHDLKKQIDYHFNHEGGDFMKIFWEVLSDQNTEPKNRRDAHNITTHQIQEDILALSYGKTLTVDKVGNCLIELCKMFQGSEDNHSLDIPCTSEPGAPN